MTSSNGTTASNVFAHQRHSRAIANSGHSTTVSSQSGAATVKLQDEPQRSFARSTRTQIAQLPRIDHLSELEAESIFILREVAAEFERPVLLFSGGKDSICLLRLAEKAFRPGRFPFPLLHVDTGHNFPEVIEYRDRAVVDLNERLIIASVDEMIANGSIVELPNEPSRNTLQIPALLAAIEKHGFDAAIGGARRDEEKARAKERVFSFRDAFGQWDPRHQRPEIGNLYNARLQQGEHMRVFPLSNWTEADVWQYIKREGLSVPSVYFSHDREVIERHGQYLPVSRFVPLKNGDVPQTRRVRMRTVGDMTCTGCHMSQADSLDQIISEVTTMRVTERDSRIDDKKSVVSMEDRKRKGYF